MSAVVAATAATGFDEEHERRVMWRLAAVVLVTLTLVKPLGGIPIVGTIGFTIAAALQLYLPLWRCEKLGLDYDAVGLHTRSWRRDLKIVAVLCALTFPPYILVHHLYMTEVRGWLEALELAPLARLFPERVLAPAWPRDVLELGRGSLWLAEVVATHSLGVALPEETFYRGYVQPRLERRWPARLHVLGTPLGRAAVVTAALFALGHFLGEWNPLRLGPFLPALVFAWQRNRTGSLLGAITFHAACNVLGELLFALYRPA